MARIPINNRILTCDKWEIELSGDPVAINLSDTVFEFLSEEFSGGLSSPAASSTDENDEKENREDDENNDEEDNDGNFWETKHQMLRATIRRTSSLESRIRNITKEAVKEARHDFRLTADHVCACSRRTFDGGRCRKCLMEAVRHRLQASGFNSAICKSKWTSTPDLPSGEHTFLEVVDDSNPKKGEVRVIIELNFRAEFEMARANEEYNRLVERLPEVFVGKMERLLQLLKIMCACSKKCMKDKKMHLGPWRKQRYMQAKWLRTTCERLVSYSSSSSLYSGRAGRPRMSMLTADIVDNFSSRRLAEAVQVL